MGISKEAVRKILQMREDMKEDRQPYEELFKDIAAYANPSMDWEEEVGERREVYDNTLQRASNKLADGIQGYAFSRNQAWFRLALEDDQLQANEAVGEFLQLVEKHFYRQFARSNFYDEGRAFVKAGADFGTSVMIRQEDLVRGCPYYKTLHLRSCYIRENAYGDVDTLFREYSLTPDEAVMEYGRENVPEVIRNAFERNSNVKFKFLQAIFPRERYNLDVGKGSKPYVSITIALAGEGHVVREGGYSAKPFFVWRYSRDMGSSPWGTNNPGQLEIYNAKQLNGMRKDRGRISQLMARPPVIASETLAGRLKLTPNGITYAKPGEDYALRGIVGNPSLLDADIQDMRSSINESYYTNLFLILSQNIDRMKTATEVSGIQGEQAAMMSAFFGRIQTEFLEPVLEDLFALELFSGRLPPIPPILKGKEIKIDMISPLAMMQKRYLALESTRQALGEILALAQARPEILDNLDLDAYVRNIADSYNMDKRVVLDELQVQKIREARLQMMQAQQEAQLALQAQKQGGNNG